MIEYSKIHTLYKRDDNLKIILGDWSLSEIEYLAHNKWLMTEKVDGQNVGIHFKDGKVTITGRSKDAEFQEEMLSRLVELFDESMVERMAKTFKGNAFTLFGEGFGPGLNGGGKYAQTHDFVLFDIYVPTVRNPSTGTYVDGWWLERHNCEDVSAKLGIEIVPSLGLMSIYDAIDIVRAGYKSQWGDFIAEGLVAKTPCELFTRKGHRLLTKIKHKDFLNISPIKPQC